MTKLVVYNCFIDETVSSHDPLIEGDLMISYAVITATGHQTVHKNASPHNVHTELST